MFRDFGNRKIDFGQALTFAGNHGSGFQLLHAEPVVLDLSDLMPVETARITDWFAEHRLICLATRHDIQPVAVPAVRRDAAFVRRQHHIAGCVPDSLNLDQPEFTRVQINACDIVAEVFFVYIVDYAALATLKRHDGLHGCFFHFGIGPQVLEFRFIPPRVG